MKKPPQKEEPEGAGVWELRDQLSQPGSGLGCGRDGLKEVLIETVPTGKEKLTQRREGERGH